MRSKNIKSPKVSVVVTFLNEEKHLPELIRSLLCQTQKPDELILIDGGSSDASVLLIQKYLTNKKFPIILKTHPGNIGQCRNYGVKLTHNELIAFTDAGCVPDKHWLKELTQFYLQNATAVVAGYYFGLPQSSFQAAVVPYVLVMPDRVNAEELLPASRSMLIEKKLFEKMGGFDEKLVVSEDFALSQKIRAYGKKINKNLISFTSKAQVGWYPKPNLYTFIKMIYMHTKYDLKAGIVRTKIVFILLRYIYALQSILMVWLITDIKGLLIYTWTLFFIYCFWSIAKNVKYAPTGWFYLPMLQITSDVAILTAMLRSLINPQRTRS